MLTILALHVQGHIKATKVNVWDYSLSATYFITLSVISMKIENMKCASIP